MNPDVIVIGGGPAGSTTSTLIAQRGYRVQLFERERFPRFHIGESLIPETYWVLQRLNMLPKMQASHFVKKYSVQFVNSRGRESAPFYFWDNKPHECSQTWQVVRSEFDKMMLDNAREHGVDVQEGVRVLEVLFDGDRAVGVRIRDQQNNDREVFAQGRRRRQRAEGDAAEPLQAADLGSGARTRARSGRTGRARTATAAATKAPRSSCRPATSRAGSGTSRSTTTSSASASSRRSTYLFNKDRESHEKMYRGEVENAPGVKQRLANAKRVTGYFATKDYSYRAKEVAGDGWVLVGDAFGFLDPLYSSGVLLALKSGQLAADAIVEGLAKGDTSAAQLGAWGADFNQRRGSHAAAGVRVLRGLQLRRVRRRTIPSCAARSPTC